MFSLFFVFFSLFALAPDMFRALELDAAIASAKTEKKNVLVVFQRAGTGDTKKLDTTTWVDRPVREWIGLKVVAVKLDVVKHDELATKMRVHVTPTLIFLNESGSEIDRITGYVDGRTFLAETKSIFGGADPVERARKRLELAPNDPHRRIDLALLLGDRGDFAASLAELMWCWDHGTEIDPSFAETRGSFLLGELLRLSRIHPPAGDALAGRAKGIYQRVVGCVVTESELADFLLLNRELQQQERTLAAFDALSSGTEACVALRDRLAPLAVDPLIDSRRYKEALALIGDPRAYFNRLGAEFRASSERIEKERPGDSLTVIDANKRAVRSASVRIYEALLGATQFDDAESFAQLVVAFDGRGATHCALIVAALKLEAHGQARALVGRALADTKLTPTEKEDVRKLARAIIQPK
ncbi:MAG: thioredoxin family protein [Planctomycetota bacterium]|nr:thioredoxin family protein [Planctomycetota bacterium]